MTSPEHLENLIQKIREDGPGALTTVELLTVIAPKKQDESIKTFHKNLLACGHEEYCKEISNNQQMDKSSAALVCAFELMERFPQKPKWGVTVTGPRDVLPLVERYRYEEQEHLLLLTLNTANLVLGQHVLTKGIVDNCQAHPREIFKHAIRDNASGIIMVHNHPSGRLIPSGQDIEMSREIDKAAKIVGIPLIDHLIIGPTAPGEQSYYSIDWR